MLNSTHIRFIFFSFSLDLRETVYPAGFCGLFPYLCSSPPAASACAGSEGAPLRPCASCIAEIASMINIKCNIPTAVGKSVPFGLLSTMDFSSQDSPPCVQNDHSFHALSPSVLQRRSESARAATSPSRSDGVYVREKRGSKDFSCRSGVFSKYNQYPYLMIKERTMLYALVCFHHNKYFNFIILPWLQGTADALGKAQPARPAKPTANRRKQSRSYIRDIIRLDTCCVWSSQLQ